VYSGIGGNFMQPLPLVSANSKHVGACPLLFGIIVGLFERTACVETRRLENLFSFLASALAIPSSVEPALKSGESGRAVARLDTQA